MRRMPIRVVGMCSVLAHSSYGGFVVDANPSDGADMKYLLYHLALREALRSQFGSE